MRIPLQRLWLLAGLLLAGVVSLGLPGATALGRPASPDARPDLAAGKLYGQLAAEVSQAGQGDHRYRVIVHMRDQADLSTWPANDRPGALRALRQVAATSQPAIRQFLAQA